MNAGGAIVDAFLVVVERARFLLSGASLAAYDSTVVAVAANGSRAASKRARRITALLSFRVGGKLQVLRVQTQILVAHVHRIAAVMRRSFQTRHEIPEASALGLAVMIRRRGRGSQGRPLAVRLRGLDVCHSVGAAVRQRRRNHSEQSVYAVSLRLRKCRTAEKANGNSSNAPAIMVVGSGTTTTPGPTDRKFLFDAPRFSEGSGSGRHGSQTAPVLRLPAPEIRSTA